MHGIIVKGGVAANIVPDEAVAQFYFRAATKETLDDILEKVKRIAEGAALMTGATLEMERYEFPNDNLVTNENLSEAFNENLRALGITEIKPPKSSGSSDIGNVSQVCPTMYTELALDIDEVCFVHDEAYLKYVNSEEAYDKLHKSVKAMTGTALELYCEPELLKVVKEDFKKLKRS